MNYYWFNRQEILQKAKENYSREKAAEYYKQNKEVIKEKSNSYKSLSKKRKREVMKVMKRQKKTNITLAYLA